MYKRQGKVNADATALGSYALADDVQILDTTAEGVAGTYAITAHLRTVSLASIWQRMMMNGLSRFVW